MNKRGIANSCLFLALFLVPMIAEYATATPEKVPGLGIDILLYYPFDFAYIMLACVLFVGLNSYMSKQANKTILKGSIIGLFIHIVWSVFSFISVMNLHLRLGGKL